MSDVQHHIEEAKCILSSTIHPNDLSMIINLIKSAYENGYQNGVIDLQEEIFNNIGNYGL